MLSPPGTERCPQLGGERVIGLKVLAQMLALLFDLLAKGPDLFELRTWVFQLLVRPWKEVELDALHRTVGNQFVAQHPFLVAARAELAGLAGLAGGGSPTVTKNEHSTVASANVCIDQFLWPTAAGQGGFPADRLEHHVAWDCLEPVVLV